MISHSGRNQDYAELDLPHDNAGNRTRVRGGKLGFDPCKFSSYYLTLILISHDLVGGVVEQRETCSAGVSCIFGYL